MKKRYLKPTSEVVKLTLLGSVLESIGVGAASKQTGWDAAAKKHSSNDWEEDADNELGEQPKILNAWDAW